MKAVVVECPNEVIIKDIPDPIVGEYGVLVKVLACSLCNSTDLKIVQGHFQYVNTRARYPCIIGHEGIGRVVEIGSKVRYYSMDDIVVRPELPNPYGALYSYWGGLAEYNVFIDSRAQHEDETGKKASEYLDKAQLITGIDPIQGTTLITIKEVLSALYRIQPQPQSKILVVGCGPVGLCFIRFTSFFGPKMVIAADLLDGRLGVARKMGADYLINSSKENLAVRVRDITQGEGVDLAIEAVGAPNLVDSLSKTLAPFGKLALYGIPPIDKKGRLRPVSFERKGTQLDWTLQYVSIDEWRARAGGVKAVKLGLIDTQDLVTHVMPFAEVEAALQLIRNNKALKVVLTF